MKFVNARPFADPEAAARKLVEIANAVEAGQDGRVDIEKINGSMLFQQKATPAEYKAGLDRAIEKAWLVPARERHVCEAYPGGRGFICLIEKGLPFGSPPAGENLFEMKSSPGKSEIRLFHGFWGLRRITVFPYPEPLAREKASDRGWLAEASSLTHPKEGRGSMRLPPSGR